MCCSTGYFLVDLRGCVVTMTIEQRTLPTTLSPASHAPKTLQSRSRVQAATCDLKPFQSERTAQRSMIQKPADGIMAKQTAINDFSESLTSLEKCWTC